MHLKKILTAIVLVFAIHSFGQTALPVPVNLQQTYINGTRTINGAPGKNYWQNRADYTIKVNFNPKNRVLNGVVDIDYVNNSPNTLEQVYFKLYPNLYMKGAVRNMKISPADETNGVQIQKLSIDQRAQSPEKWSIDGTNMVLSIPTLVSKQKMHFTITYSYILNKTSHIRAGQVDSGAFFIAYFFPRVAVYDDIDGWNQHPYLGTEEFYNDFCHFNAEITVPGNYEVWATGNLKNVNEVYQPKIAARIAAAEQSDNVTDIITAADQKSNSVTTKGATHTWKIEADSVTDFAIAISNHYVWKASSLIVDPISKRRTRVDAVYNTSHNTYLPVINYARKTVETMSYGFPKWPYPYPHETIFDGLDQMEYPMMVNDNPVDNEEQDIELTDHEIFHTMFPFYMGTNETKYGWMDEGWATIAEWLISPAIRPGLIDGYGMDAYNSTAGTEEDMPVMTLTPALVGASVFTDSYPKPAMGYLYVKDMLGDSLFTKALHYYIAQWHGKHPMPYDFFNCMNTGSGVDMNWFWKAWFFDNGVPDLAISNVAKQQNYYIITITSKGTKPVPIDLNLFYSDGSSRVIHKSVACWQNGNRIYTLNFTDDKPIFKLVLGSVHTPDVNKADNVYMIRPGGS